MTRPAACSKGHSCEICLSNYVPKHFSMAFIATASKGIRCCCCRCFVCKNKQVLQCTSANSTEARFLQRPTQSIQREQHMGLRRHKASHIHKWLTPIQKLNRKVRVDILDEHYSFRVFFSKLCYALRGTCQKGPSKTRWWFMNPIRSTVSFEHEVPGADVLLLISAPNASHGQMGLRRQKASHIHKSLTIIHRLNC